MDVLPPRRGDPATADPREPGARGGGVGLDGVGEVAEPAGVTMVSSLISPLLDWALIRLTIERLPNRFTARWIEAILLLRP